MFSTAKFDTADGGTVEFTRVGITYDLHYRNAAGETCATVTMNEDAALSLADQLSDELGTGDDTYDAGYSTGYDEGYSDAEADAA